jgi:hypothetical protein
LFRLLSNQITVEPWSGTFRFDYGPFIAAFIQADKTGPLFFENLEKLVILESEFKDVVAMVRERKKDQKPIADDEDAGGRMAR